MSFMQKQVTYKQTWVELDGTSGTTALPADVLTKHELAVADSVMGDNSADPEDLTAHFGDYYEGTVQSVTVREGYGARLYLDEYYPDDEEENDTQG